MQIQCTARVPLRARDGSVRAYTLIDAADAEWVNQWRWYLGSHGYAMHIFHNGGDRLAVLMHRELLGLAPGDSRQGDHINRDRLDNRRVNLRVLSPMENAHNTGGQRDSTSAHRGVSWDKVNAKWKAQIKLGGRGINLGRFTSEAEAAEAARVARARLMPSAID